MKKSASGVLAVFEHMDQLNNSIKYLKASGRSDITVFTPCPRHEIADAMSEKTSPVRMLTLIGGMLGVSTGYLFTSFASLVWILPTSGKAVVALQAFTIPAFELTILFGSILTIAAIILMGRLARPSQVMYDDRFTDDRFGIFVPCEQSDYEKLEKTLKDKGAEEVKHAS
jgi:hypothetical protein